MLRALLSSIVFVFLTFLGSVLAIPSGLIDRTGDLVLWLARWWARGVLASAGVRVRVRSHATFDPKTSYVFMPNHVSTADIWAIFVAVPVPLRFIAKKQLGYIPLFGWAMRAGRFIFIDRQNAASAHRTIDQAADQIRDGRSVVIFPEGTRSLDGRLAPFKKGAFHLAIKAGAAVVPVAIRGSREIMPSGAFLIHPGVVDIELGAPIPTTGLGPDDRQALLDQTRAEVGKMLDAQISREPGAASDPAAAP